MNWLQFQNDKFVLTEDEIAILAKQIMWQYKKSIVDIRRQIEGQYIKYLSSVGTIDYYNELLKYNRLQMLLDNVRAAYITYSARAQALTEHAISIAASNTYYRSVYAAGWIVDIKFRPIPYGLVELITYGTAGEWKAISQRVIDEFGSLQAYQTQSGTLIQAITRNRSEEIRKIQQSIITGLQQGQSVPQMSSAITDVIGRISAMSGGQITATGAMANAMRIIRTESTRAMNAAAYAAEKELEYQGFDVQKLWHSALDNRTRAAHARLDGKVIGIDEKFSINGDYALKPGGFSQVKNNVHCRCTNITLIDGEKPMLRTGRNPTTGEHEVFDFQDFDAWAKEKGLKKNVYGEIYS